MLHLRFDIRLLSGNGRRHQLDAGIVRSNRQLAQLGKFRFRAFEVAGTGQPVNELEPLVPICRIERDELPIQFQHPGPFGLALRHCSLDPQLFRFRQIFTMGSSLFGRGQCLGVVTEHCPGL